MDYVTRNGAFDQPTPLPVGATATSRPPWYFTRLRNVTGDFVGENTGPFNVNSGAAARFQIVGQPVGSFSDFGALAQRITYCSGTTYTISFAARQNQSTTQTCRLGFFTTSEGTILTLDNQLTPVWTEYPNPLLSGPCQWSQTFRDNLCEQNPDGTFSDELQIQVQCFGVAGQVPSGVEIEIDSIYIQPVY
ncbi:hypothetical protein LTR66_011614 [Elasticomyces elasticus]|nr:hypothetical protein LTR66_011614 [Elasticomyces elasticus]